MCSRTTANYKSRNVAIYTVLRAELGGKRMSRKNTFFFFSFSFYFFLFIPPRCSVSFLCSDRHRFLYRTTFFFIIFLSSFYSFLCSSCFGICLVFPRFLFSAFLLLDFSPPLSLQWRQQLGSCASISPRVSTH